MKALKISLAVIVAVAIAIFIIMSLDTPIQKPKISLPENQCTTRKYQGVERKSTTEHMSPLETHIIKYIKGEELNKDTLNGYLTKIKKNPSLTKSVKLCLKLYELNGKTGSSYYSLRKEIKGDDYLKESKLYEFIDSMCIITKSNKYYLEGTDKDKSKTLSQIKTKLKSKGTK